MPARRQTVITDINPPSSSNESGKESEKTPQELREEACNGILQIVQLGCITFGLFSDAGAIGMFGPPLVEESVKLADNNKQIAKKMDLLVEVGPYAGIVGAAIPFAAQILVNHKIVKPEAFANAGVVSPDILETQMKTTMMKRAMESMQQQYQMEKEMRAMQEEMMANANANGNGTQGPTEPNDE